MSEGKQTEEPVTAEDALETEPPSIEPQDENQEPADEVAEADDDPLSVARREAEDYKDRWMRLAAEFDNFKKRTARERMALVQSANEDLMRELLPVKDSVDRALAHADGSTDSDGFREGMRMIMEIFPKALADNGLEEIDAIGKAFDPHDHEALMQMPSDAHDAGHVMEVVERGYRLGDRVLRHAKVVVSLGPAKPADEEVDG